jgi:hypothetical protein
MDIELIEIEEQLERCRRLSRVQTDEQMRNSLEKLASEYEARLRRRRQRRNGPFMLRGQR